jgi:hypothetical protein
MQRVRNERSLYPQSRAPLIGGVRPNRVKKKQRAERRPQDIASQLRLRRQEHEEEV